MTIDHLEYLSLTQAAKVLGYTGTSYLRTRCIAGDITEAAKEGKLWYIHRSWVMAEKEKAPTGQGARGKGRRKSG